MSAAARAAREMAAEYRRRYGAEQDPTRRLVLEEIQGAFSEFAEWLEDCE